MSSPPSAPATPEGVTLWTETDGRIQQVGTDALGLTFQCASGVAFSSLIAEGSRTKAQRFLETVRREGLAFDWELLVQEAEETRILHFSGATIGPRMLIVGAPDAASLARLQHWLERHAQIGPEQERPSAEPWGRERALRGPDIYDELSRLNNEILTLQRDLLQRNRALQQQARDLETLHEEKNQLFGVAAHDLRTPLTVVRISSRYLAERVTGLTDDQRQLLHNMQESCDFMLRMVDDLLDYATVQAGRLELVRKPIDLVTVLERSVSLIRALAAQKGVEIRLLHAAPAPPVLADAARVGQVLNNLLTNAVRYSPAHGRIEVRLDRRGGWVEIAVRDEGPGIARHEVQRLFAPFQTGREPSGEPQGTGLGLAIAQKLVRAHGGELRVDTDVGRGSTFTMALPVEGPEARAT